MNSLFSRPKPLWSLAVQVERGRTNTYGRRKDHVQGFEPKTSLLVMCNSCENMHQKECARLH